MTVSKLVSRERARLRVAIAARGLALAVAGAAVIVALSAVALSDARWITRPAAPGLAWLLATALVGVALWRMRRETRVTASSTSVAAAIERERALRAGSLRGALEVGDGSVLGRKAAKELASRLARQRGMLAPGLHRRAWRRGVVAAAVALFGLASVAAARQIAPDGWRAVSNPVEAWTGTLLPPLAIVDVPRFVVRGERVQIRISAPERRRLVLHSRATGAGWAARQLAVQGGEARVELGPLDADLALVAADGRVRSDTVLVRVTDRPFVGDVAIRAEYPPYLGRAAEDLPVGEPARVPRGTVLAIQGRASTTLSSIGLARGSDTLRLEPVGHTFRGRVSSLESGRWVWLASGAHGAIADVPAPLELDVVADSLPQVEILAPTTDTLVPMDDRVVVRMAASDDHGLAAIVLRSWRRLATGRALPEVTQPMPAPREPQWTGDATLDLSARGLEPGDELHVVVEATDNSPWRQRASSRQLVIRVPSLTERREMARSTADSAVARAASVAKAQRELEQRTSEAAKARGQRPEASASRSGSARQEQAGAMSYESAERTRVLAQEQQALREEVRQLQRDAQSLERQLAGAGALDSALQQQLREVQAMLRDALTPEMQAKLEELMRATQQLSGDEARDAMQSLAQHQQRLREALERSAEMLKRAAAEGKMETLRDEATEIAAAERAVADSLARQAQEGRNASGQRDRQQQETGRELSDRSRELSREIERLAKQLEQERAQSGPKKLASAAQRAERSADAMQRAASPRAEPTGGERRQQGQQGQQQQQGRTSEQAAAAREAAAEMERAAEQLADARQSQIEEWKGELTGDLDRSIQEMLQMGREQQQLAQRARQGAEQGELRADQSALQQGVERVSERVPKGAQQSSHISGQSQSAIGEARRRVQQATQQVSESQRGAQEASSAMEDAAQALNRAAAALVKDRERVNNAGSASGFAEMLQQMQEMAREQGQLNGQAAGLMPMPGNQPGSQAQAQARSLGRQQRGLAERMDDIASEPGGGRAADFAKEMRQIAEALETGRLDGRLLERQQQLFRRLLDAGLSLEKDEQDDKGERESRSASGTELITPGTGARGRDATRFREPTWTELRGLSAEERRAILDYFKRINAEKP